MRDGRSMRTAIGRCSEYELDQFFFSSPSEPAHYLFVLWELISYIDSDVKGDELRAERNGGSVKLPRNPWLT